jgi:hypothetical protein
MRMGPMIPTVPVPRPSEYVEATRLKWRKLGSECSAPITTVSPGPSMYCVNNRTRRCRSSIIRTRALNAPRVMPLWGAAASSSSEDLRKARLCEPQRSGHQFVIQHTVLAQSLDNGGAHLGEGLACELGVQVVGGLRELSHRHVLVDVDDLVILLAARGHNHDQHAPIAQGQEVDLLERANGRRRGHGERHVMRCFRQDVRHE